ADEDPGRSRDVDVDYVEDFAVRLVLVEPMVEEIAQVRPGLGAADRVGAPDRAGEWIAIAEIVLGRITQKRADIARSSEPQSHDYRVFRRINQFIDFFRLEPRKKADMHIVGDETGLAR